ncbi:DEAD/DEAH box helicase [Cellulomonas sp. APG4]|nr:DEAD/DEAH box helicase [Cellulomonas sp. APG4]NCT92039.1 DEAD/DEAH box helicase [Cellulomonas sp. APG4]
MAGFSPATRDWFASAFDAPTAAQAGAWDAVRAGQHALVVAPTGSGKTLAAFLSAIDGLLTTPPPDDSVERCRVLYVSPLKALASDVERNLRSPLVGIRQAAARRGETLPEVSVGVRTGDTPASERRAFATRPPDVLITTPESLFLVLTSGARNGLVGVRTVILDEIHAVAGTKRGAHLALSLERLDALLDAHAGPAQRVGLSATVRPVERVAGFLAGARPLDQGGRRVTVVQPTSTKRVEVEVVVPVPDLADLRAAPVPGLAGGAATDDPATEAADTPGGPRRGTPTGRGVPEPDLSGPAASSAPRPSIWPHVEERVVDLVAGHRSTLVFTNSRRGAERLTSRINEVWALRQGEDVPDPATSQPAAVPAQSGTSAGVSTADAATVLARAHHGSMSRAERTRTESELKAGRLPAVVATSSLELGIDMGAVDLVVQVGSPPSVASGLQRVGRAGHQVGAVSRGIVFPTFRGELIPAAVVAARMRAGEIEELSVPANPLDVLAQQVVAMVAVEDWTLEDLTTLVRRASPFTELGDGTLRAVLDMLAGRYPSEAFAELRPRIVWDRTTGTLSGRPSALRLAVTSGGTIPDRGLYGVFLATGADQDAAPTDGGSGGTRQRGGRRVGELDEEMVYESRVGDTFTLGSSTWRIEDITPDRVLVTPAPGLPGRLPFWKGDSPGRPAELGRALGAWVRGLGTIGADEARARVRATGLDPWAGDNLLAYLDEQREATGRVPDDTTLVVERFRDEIGDWRIVVHSPYGARVHAPWALVIAARLRERYGVDAAAMHSDDGIVLRLPDVVAAGYWDEDAARWVEPDSGPEVDLTDLLVEPDEVLGAVRDELGGSALFAARFREAAARALLLPRRRPDRRQPLWQQRQRSAQLLAVAAEHPEFPILLEAARECLQDDFDVAALAALMADVAAGRVRVVEVTTSAPSPFAQSLLFGYTAQFLYEGDAPLAERRAAALTLDPTLLAELLGQEGASQIADLLDPGAVEQTEAELMRTAPERQARGREDLADLLRTHGPLTVDEVLARSRADVRGQVPTMLDELARERRAIRVRASSVDPWWAAVEDAGRLRDALGVALPVGVPEDFTELVADPVGDLVRRHARTHGPFTTAQVAHRFGLGAAVAGEALARLERSGVVLRGRLRPDSLGGTGEDWCDTEVMRTLRRRSLAALRAEVEPVDERALGVFLPRWQAVTETGPAGPSEDASRTRARPRGVDALVRAVEQLAGAVVPASALETLVLPARVADYAPAMLDELTASGEVLWAGHSSLASRDGLISLHPTATADLTLPEPPAIGDLPDGVDGPVHRAVLDVLTHGGAFFGTAVVERVREALGHGPRLDAPDAQAVGAATQASVTSTAVTEALWDLVWAGLVTNDSLGPLRARLGSGTGRSGGTAHRARRVPPRLRGLGTGLALRPGRPAAADQTAGGRWSLLPPREADPTVRAHALAAQLLDRHGVLTRAVAPAEGVGARFGQVYRVLAALEQAGKVRRGYFVEHLGGSQFALPHAVDALRDDARDAAAEPGHAVLLAATDPANPYGAALPWPDRGPAGRHRPGRKAGSVVVLVDGELVLYVERGGRSLLSFTERADPLARAAEALAAVTRRGALGRLTVQRVDGAELLDREVLGSPAVTALTAAGFGTTPRGLRLRTGP